MSHPLDVSPKLSAAALAGSMVTVGTCVLGANGIHIEPGVAASAVVILSSIIAYFAPAKNGGNA